MRSLKICAARGNENFRKMAEYLLDLNILTAVFKGDMRIRLEIESLDAAIETVVYLELIQAAKNNVQAERIEKYLTGFELIHFDNKISERAIELIRNYSKSFGLKLPDSIIAATCLENNLTLITLNPKDFRFIEGLKLYRI